MKILKFTAANCPPCKLLDDALKSIDPDVPIITYNAATDMGRFEKHGVTDVPVLIMTIQNRPIKRLDGFINEENLKQWLNLW